MFWTSPTEGGYPNPHSSEANDRLKARILARQNSSNHSQVTNIPEITTNESSFLSSLNSLWPSEGGSTPPPVIITPTIIPEISIQPSFSTGGLSTVNDSEKKTVGSVPNYSIPVVQTPHGSNNKVSMTVPSLMIPKPEPIMNGSMSSSSPTSPFLTFNGVSDVHASSSSVVPPSSPTYQSSIWPFGSSSSRIPDEELAIFQQQYLAVEQERNELLAEKQARIDMIDGHNPLLGRRLKEIESRLKMNNDKVIQLTAEKDYLCDALKVAQGQSAASYELVHQKQKQIDDLERNQRTNATRDTGQLNSASSLLDNAGAEIKHLQDLVNAKQQKIDELSRENRVNEYGYQDKLQGAKDLVDGARTEIKHLHDRIALLERSIVNPPPPPPPPPLSPSNQYNPTVSSMKLEVLDAVSPSVKGTAVGNKNLPNTPPAMHPADQRWIDAAFEGSNVTDTTMNDMNDRLRALEAAAMADKKKMADLQNQLEQATKRAKRRSCWC